MALPLLVVQLSAELEHPDLVSDVVHVDSSAIFLEELDAFDSYLVELLVLALFQLEHAVLLERLVLLRHHDLLEADGLVEGQAEVLFESSVSCRFRGLAGLVLLVRVIQIHFQRPEGASCEQFLPVVDVGEELAEEFFRWSIPEHHVRLLSALALVENDDALVHPVQQVHIFFV